MRNVAKALVTLGIAVLLSGYVRQLISDINSPERYVAASQPQVGVLNGGGSTSRPTFDPHNDPVINVNRP